MARVAVPLDLPEPPDSLRNLANYFQPINAAVSGVTIQCSVCRERGRVNAKLFRRGERFVCGECRVAS